MSQQQIGSFEADGFLIIQDVLTPEQLAEARRLVDGLVERSRTITESDDLFDLDIGHTAEKPMIGRGSHKGGALDHHEDGVFVGGIGPGRGADFSKAVPVEVHASGISMHGPFIVHGSSPNRSSQQRRLLLYGYQSSDQWKLFDGMTDKDLPAEFERRREKLVRGELTTVMHVEDRVLRMPFPKPEQGNLFVIQRSQKERYFK